MPNEHDHTSEHRDVYWTELRERGQPDPEGHDYPEQQGYGYDDCEDAPIFVERSASVVRADEELEARIHGLLVADRDIDASSLEVRVDNGELTLTGTVDDRYQRQVIEDILARVAGLRDIHLSIDLRRRKVQ